MAGWAAVERAFAGKPRDRGSVAEFALQLCPGQINTRRWRSADLPADPDRMRQSGLLAVPRHYPANRNPTAITAAWCAGGTAPDRSAAAGPRAPALDPAPRPRAWRGPAGGPAGGAAA